MQRKKYDNYDDGFDSLFGKLSIKYEEQEDGLDSESNFIKMKEQIPSLVRDIYSQDYYKQERATKIFRNLVSVENPPPPIQQIIDTGCVPKFVKFLYYHNRPNHRYLAAWLLTNLAYGTVEQTRVIVENGGISAFVSILKQPNLDEQLREQAFWGLGNITVDSPENRDLIISKGVFPLLLQVFHNHQNVSISMVRVASWTLLKLCSVKPKLSNGIIGYISPVLRDFLLNCQDPDVLSLICRTISIIINLDSYHHIQEFLESNIFDRLIQLLDYSNTSIQSSALRIFGNLVLDGDTFQIQFLLDSHFLQHISNLLQSPISGIRKEVCWIISNIAAGGVNLQIQQIMNSNIVSKLMVLLKNDEMDIKKEAAWAISNLICFAKPYQIKYIVIDQVCIKPLCDLLDIVDDLQFILNILSGIECILNSGKHESSISGVVNPYIQIIKDSGVFHIINKLQNHSDSKIIDSVKRIIYNYFNNDNQTNISILYSPMKSLSL